MSEAVLSPAGDRVDDPSVVVRRTRSGSGGSRTRALPVAAFELAGVLLGPVVLFFLLGAEPYFLQNALDPQIYMGFAAEPDVLFERFGNTTYYGVRFGLLWPMELTTKLFGVTGGFFVMRWGLAVLACGTVYWSLRRLSGRPVACAAALFFITSPVTLRGLMTAYADTTSLVFLLAGASLLLVARAVPRRWLVLLGAGLLLAFAVHSNPFNVIAVAVVVGAWSVVEVRSRRWRLLLDYGILLGVALAVTGLAMAVYQVRFGFWNVVSPSIDGFRSTSSHEVDPFRSVTHEWLKFQVQLYVPIIVVVAYVAANVRSLRRVVAWELASVLMLCGMYAVLAADQFLRDGVMLETYFYSSALSPFTALAVAATLSSLWRNGSVAELTRWLVVALLVALPFVIDRLPGELAFGLFPWVPLFLVATGALALLSARAAATDAGDALRSRLATVAGVALLVSNSLLLFAPPRGVAEGTLFSPYYEQALGNRDRFGLDVYRLSFEFVELVPDLVSADGKVFVWSNPLRDPISGTLGGPFVGFSSTFQSLGPGIPEVSDWLASRIPYEPVDQLVLYDRDPAMVDQGEAALRARGVTITDVDKHVMSSGDLRYFVTILDIEP